MFLRDDIYYIDEIFGQYPFRKISTFYGIVSFVFKTNFWKTIEYEQKKPYDTGSNVLGWILTTRTVCFVFVK